ncbi:Bud site selection protein 6 [Ascosphaera pollenicola]|nr:Bud site selection protein 6 [Ascosphaera pollenicola]
MLKPRSKIRVPKRGIAGTSVNEESFDAIWGKLAAAFQEIHTKNASKLSFEELYRAGYRLVLKKQGERLYDNVCNLEAEYLCLIILCRLPDSFVARSEQDNGHEREE